MMGHRTYILRTKQPSVITLSGVSHYVGLKIPPPLVLLRRCVTNTHSKERVCEDTLAYKLLIDDEHIIVV